MHIIEFWFILPNFLVKRLLNCTFRLNLGCVSYSFLCRLPEFLTNAPKNSECYIQTDFKEINWANTPGFNDIAVLNLVTPGKEHEANWRNRKERVWLLCKFGEINIFEYASQTQCHVKDFMHIFNEMNVSICNEYIHIDLSHIFRPTEADVLRYEVVGYFCTSSCQTSHRWLLRDYCSLYFFSSLNSVY